MLPQRCDLPRPAIIFNGIFLQSRNFASSIVKQIAERSPTVGSLKVQSKPVFRPSLKQAAKRTQRWCLPYLHCMTLPPGPCGSCRGLCSRTWTGKTKLATAYTGQSLEIRRTSKDCIFRTRQRKLHIFLELSSNEASQKTCGNVFNWFRETCNLIESTSSKSAALYPREPCEKSKRLSWKLNSGGLEWIENLQVQREQHEQHVA